MKPEGNLDLHREMKPETEATRVNILDFLIILDNMQYF